MHVTRWKPVWWALGAIGAMTIGTPEVAESQILGDTPNPTARELYNRAPLGPRIRSSAEASMQARLPELNESTCRFDAPFTWSFDACGSFSRQNSEAEIVTTTADATARYDIFALEPWPPIFGCISNLATPLGNSCQSGARAQTNFGESRVYAEVRWGFEETVPYDDADPSLGEYTYSIDTYASASSEWVSEFTPTFTGWLSLQFSVERHGASRTKDEGTSILGIGVFARPDNPLSPPERVGDLEFDPQWTFYGRDEESINNPNFWGWSSPYAERIEAFGFGVTPVTGGLFVEAGRSYTLVSLLTAEAMGNQFIDFWGTARFDAFEVPEGVDPTSAFRTNSAGFAVRMAGAGGGAAVPEPATSALLVAGLAGVSAVHHRRRRRAALPR